MKKKKLLAILVVLLLIVGAGVFTYARYTTTYEGTGEVGVAKWAVTIDGGNVQTKTFNLNLSLSENSNVVNGKIAPGRSATASLVLDLTGTEVAVDYEIDLGEVTGLPDGMAITGVTADGTALTKVDTKYTGLIALNSDKTALDDVQKTIAITLEWENDESNNANDTTTGETLAKISIPVNVTIKQHIG